ncbi:MAG: hypothetical protein R6X11_06565 [Desulfonatronovibrio sp.]
MFKNCMILTVLVVFLGLPQLSQAMCAYNRSEHKMQVDFNCGVTCWESWQLHQNEKGCYPNKGGTIWYSYYIGDDKDRQCYAASLSDLDEHGWATTRGSDSNLELCAKRSNGSIKACTRFERALTGRCQKLN